MTPASLSSPASPIPKTYCAFTLMEMLICISILIILLALILPGLSSMQKRAQATQCLANLRTYGVAVLTAVADNQSLPYWDGKPEASTETEKPNWDQWLFPDYLSHRLHCSSSFTSDNKRTAAQKKLRYGYSGNEALCTYYPKLVGIPAPASRVVLAAEFVLLDNCFGADALTASMRGGNSSNPQYHGTPERRGGHVFFLDGSSTLVQPHENDWSKSPTYGDANNNGYFYDYNQFKKMKAGTLFPH